MHISRLVKGDQTLILILTTVEIIDLTKETRSKCKPIQYWIKDLALYTQDKKCLLNGGWLSDAVITAGQTLLKEAYILMLVAYSLNISI